MLNRRGFLSAWVLALPSVAPKSSALRNAELSSPLPDGILAGYAGDTGLDIAAKQKPVFAIAAGSIDYAEPGHTRWVGKGDTPNSIRLKLAEPIAFLGRTKSSKTAASKASDPAKPPPMITHVYYTHMASLALSKAEGSEGVLLVSAGQLLGVSGIGNGMPHLHIGLLLDNQVEQDSWQYILREAEIRAVFGGYKPGEKLP
jgi:murein DD-endopeptidase MepM/ murein hydrolase activator NlpD